MIEKIKIKKRTGISLIVLLGWAPFSNIVCAFFACMFMCKANRLQYDPKFWITNKLNLGSGLLWGCIYLFPGLLISATVIPSSFGAGDSQAFWTFLILFPLVFIGIFLIIASLKHKRYLASIEALLYAILNNQKISKTNFRLSVYGQSKTYDFSTVRFWLEDLRQNDILKFWDEPGTDNVIIELTAPELSLSTPGDNKGKGSVNGQFIKWTCSSCGAENQTLSSLLHKTVCEYCGMPSKIEAEK